MCLLDLWSTVVLEPYPFGNPQQHPSSIGDARELASRARDTGHRYGSSGKTSPNDRIPGAGVCADGQGSDGRLHSIGRESFVRIEEWQVPWNSITGRCRMICLSSHARSAVASGWMILPRLRNLDDPIVPGVGDIDVAHRIECHPPGHADSR
jgi:hypothetical protein